MYNENKKVFWDKSKETGLINCPKCQLEFGSFDQLEVHTNHYCTPDENFEILKKHFNSLEKEFLLNRVDSTQATKLIVLLKGLLYVKQEWLATQNYLQHTKNSTNKFDKVSANNFNMPIYAKDQSAIGTNFDPGNPLYFSDNTQKEVDSMIKFPMLQGVLRDKGTEQTRLGLDENFKEHNTKHYPGWFSEYKREARKKRIDDTNLIYGFDADGLSKINPHDFHMSTQKEVFDNPEYLKYLEVLRQDAGADMKMKDIQFYLGKSSKDNKEKFFDKLQKPRQKEIESLLVELEERDIRQAKCSALLNDLWVIHDTMSQSLLTPIDFKKRAELQKLIGKREILHQREIYFYRDLEDLKLVFFDRREFDYYGRTVPADLEDKFMNLWMKHNYKRIILDNENDQIQKELARLKLEHFQHAKNSSTMLLGANNRQNEDLNDQHADYINPTLNRPRKILAEDKNSTKLLGFQNYLRDIQDVKEIYYQLGANFDLFNNNLKKLEESIKTSHTIALRQDVNSIVKDPKYESYAYYQLTRYRDNEIISDNELKYYMGDLKIRGYQAESSKQRNMAKYANFNQKKNAEQQKLSSSQPDSLFECGEYAYLYDPIHSMVLLKSDDSYFKKANDTKSSPYDHLNYVNTVDSLSSLGKKQDQMLSIQRVKQNMAQTEEQRFKLNNLEKFEELAQQMESQGKLVEQDDKAFNIMQQKSTVGLRPVSSKLNTSRSTSKDKKPVVSRRGVKTTAVKKPLASSSRSKVPSKSTDKKAPAKKSSDKKAPAKKAPAKRSTDKKAPAKKAPARTKK